jgi:hypothetical protein
VIQQLATRELLTRNCSKRRGAHPEKSSLCTEHFGLNSRCQGTHKTCSYASVSANTSRSAKALATEIHFFVHIDCLFEIIPKICSVARFRTTHPDRNRCPVTQPRPGRALGSLPRWRGCLPSPLARSPNRGPDGPPSKPHISGPLSHDFWFRDVLSCTRTALISPWRTAVRLPRPACDLASGEAVCFPRSDPSPRGLQLQETRPVAQRRAADCQPRPTRLTAAERVHFSDARVSARPGSPIAHASRAPSCHPPQTP